MKFSAKFYLALTNFWSLLLLFIVAAVGAPNVGAQESRDQPITLDWIELDVALRPVRIGPNAKEYLDGKLHGRIYNIRHLGHARYIGVTNEPFYRFDTLEEAKLKAPSVARDYLIMLLLNQKLGEKPDTGLADDLIPIGAQVSLSYLEFWPDQTHPKINQKDGWYLSVAIQFYDPADEAQHFGYDGSKIRSIEDYLNIWSPGLDSLKIKNSTFSDLAQKRFLNPNEIRRIVKTLTHQEAKLPENFLETFKAELLKLPVEDFGQPEDRNYGEGFTKIIQIALDVASGKIPSVQKDK